MSASSGSPIPASSITSKTQNGYHHNNATNGKSEETKQRLIEFYKEHNPEKLKDEAAINEIVNRYSGREEFLFSELNRKYTLTNGESTSSNHCNETQNGDGNEQTQQQQLQQQQQMKTTNDIPPNATSEAQRVQSADDEDDEDEHSPLNSKPATPINIKVLPPNEIHEVINKSNNKRKKPVTPQSMSNRKISKQVILNESPPESELDDDEDEDEENTHPIMLDMDTQSESTPLALKKSEKETKKERKRDREREKLTNLVPTLGTSQSFKIEVTKPTKKALKKKPLGTNLFGSSTLNKKDQPLFGKTASNSYSGSARSTSFISNAGSLDSMPTAVLNIV